MYMYEIMNGVRSEGDRCMGEQYYSVHVLVCVCLYNSVYG